MYKVQNLTKGCLSFSLEKGSVILQGGQYLDLDGICSRKWIRSNENLCLLIRKKAIRVIHDSEADIPRNPVPVEIPGLLLPDIPIVTFEDFSNEDTSLASEEPIDEKFELIDSNETFEPTVTLPPMIPEIGHEIIQILSFDSNYNLKTQELSVISTERTLIDPSKKRKQK